MKKPSAAQRAANALRSVRAEYGLDEQMVADLLREDRQRRQMWRMLRSEYIKGCDCAFCKLVARRLAKEPRK